MRFKILTIVFCFVIGSGISYADLGNDLVSGWTFDDGTAKDYQGNNDGEIKGGVEVVEGKFEKALSFNGTDGFVEVPHNESMNTIEDGFTISAWIKSEAGTHGNSGIVTKGEGTGWGIKYSFKVTVAWWGVSSASTEGYFNTDGSLNKPGEWILACLTADGTEAIGYTGSEDGQVAAKPHTISGPYLVEPDFPIEIGVARMADGTTDRFFMGVIDEVYFWGRPLSENEVVQLAKGTRPEFTASLEPQGKLSILWGTIKDEAQ